MTIRNAEEAAQVAERTHTNIHNACQMQTRGYFNAPSAGDQDRDGDADAVDGWLSEPKSARHEITDHMPRGYPIAWAGGSNGNGHRAITLGGNRIRSTDWPRARVTSDTTVEELERAWPLLRRLGWSTTIDGFEIPDAPKPKPLEPTLVSEFQKGGPQWNVALLDRAIRNGRGAQVKHVRDRIDDLVKSLPHDKSAKSRVNQFVAHYNKTRVLRMGLLNNAVSNGRKGKVKSVRDALRRQIHALPPR